MSLVVNDDLSQEYLEDCTVSFWYPDNKGLTEETLYVDLDHVRAARGLTIKYDFDRDGWSIVADISKDDFNYMPGEVAFIPAWEDDDAGSES
jgi:hypothetical protein